MHNIYIEARLPIGMSVESMLVNEGRRELAGEENDSNDFHIITLL